MFVETSATVDFDLTCIGCGYNLRTMPFDGRCPECTRPVKESVGGWGPVLESRADVLKLRRRIGFYLAASLFEIVAGILFRIATLFCMQLQPKGWYRFVLYRWFEASVLAQVFVGVATILILFACSPHPWSRHRRLAWLAAPFAIGFGILDFVWLIGFRLGLSQLQSLVQLVLSYAFSSLASVMVAAAMWFLLRSVVPPREHPWLRRLCLLGMMPAIIGFLSILLCDLPHLVGIQPVMEFDVFRFLGPPAYGDAGIAECVTILQLCILWVLLRALGQSNNRVSHTSNGPAFEQFKPV